MTRESRDEVIERGRRVRTQLLGPQSGERGPSERVLPGIGELSDEALWGGIWARPGLDLKTRSLCTVVALVALERFEYARGHMRGAKNVGFTKEELAEAMLQLTFYVGLPVVHSALRLVAEVYDDEVFDDAHAP